MIKVNIHIGTFKAQQCPETLNWYCTGVSGRKYWGHSARAAEQNAQLYFYR